MPPLALHGCSISRIFYPFWMTSETLRSTSQVFCGMSLICVFSMIRLWQRNIRWKCQKKNEILITLYKGYISSMQSNDFSLRHSYWLKWRPYGFTSAELLFLCSSQLTCSGTKKPDNSPHLGSTELCSLLCRELTDLFVLG